jgi:hypothetical protein
MDRWVRRFLGVRARCAYSGLVWRAHDVSRERAMASRLKNSSLMLFSNLIFSGFSN